MGIYTLSLDYIKNVTQNHFHNVLMPFANPEREHKVAIDKTKVILNKYIEFSENNVDFQTWLDWMSRREDQKFEIINVNIPKNISDEEMYLKIAEATNPCKKVIVHSYQEFTNFSFRDNTNNILYNNKEINILDRDEIYKELNLQKNNTMGEKNNPWTSGTFYLFALIIIVAIVIASVIFMPWYAVPIIFIISTVILSIIGALQLKNDNQLSDKSFIELMIMSLKQIRLFKKNE